MKPITPPAAVVPFGLRAMAMIARAAPGGLVDTHRTMLDTVQRVMLGTQVDIATLPDIDLDTLAEHFSDPALSRQLIRGMVVLSLAVGPPSDDQTALIRRFAHALGVDEPAIRTIDHLAREELVTFLADLHRRSNLRDYLENQYRAQGIVSVVKGLLQFRGILHDDALAGRFRALAELPPGTLGRSFYDHYTVNGFAFPGEKGGFPLGALFHDFGHVIAGYDTTPEGELQIACFQAGYRQTENAFFTILFAVLIHTAGVNVAPIPMPRHPGRIGEGELFAQMIHALERGSQLATDLGDNWDFWPLTELELADVRRSLGVPPLAPEFRSSPGVYGPPIGNW